MSSPLRLLAPTLLLLAGCTSPDADDTDDDTIADVQTFEACEDQDFGVIDPVEGFAWTPLAITLTSERLADGVFAIYDSNADAFEPAGFPLATSSGFVIGDDGVLLIDTMINRQLLCQVYDLVRAETDKPITYAVNTSYHGDHSYGNAFLPADVTVVQHERTAAAIAANFVADVQFMEGAFGADQGIAEVTPVVPDIAVTDAGWSVDLGGVEVQAQYHGFAQTEGDLFIYVPEANVLWTGNPMVASEPAIPWLLEGHAHDVSLTLAAVQDALPAGATIVPGHGRPASASNLDFPIDYLDALIGEVDGAITSSLTLEETQTATTMESFQGYALWDWVHTTINVPATFAELSE